MTRDKYLVMLLAIFIVAASLLVNLFTAVAAPTAPTAFGRENAFPGVTFPQPTDITHANDNRLFIAQQPGLIKVIPLGSTTATTFLDIQGRVNDGGSEQGLLGLAFHPNYPNTPYFYVNYINASGDTHISRFSVTDNPNVADPNSEIILLTVDQPYTNHNGGDLNFGPDGYLYIGLGDGGSGNDPQNYGQRLNTLLGKILRIDVDGNGLPPDCDPSGQYSIPEDNPFVGQREACNEIWAYGLRNPWRFSFDRETGDMFIGDVGQNAWEEVDFQPASSSGGENYGWCYYEGTHVNTNPTCQADLPATHIPPIHEYAHAEGCSVTGGFIYRGTQFPSLNGTYFYADYCSGKIWGLTQDGNNWNNALFEDTSSNITTFGEDACGNVYVSLGSSIFRIIDSGTPEAPQLCLSKSGPTAAEPGAPITFTLHLNNTGSAPATNIAVTDALPDNALYVGGGTLSNGTVSWNIAGLAARDTAVLQFVVTATQTITNDTYSYNADGGYTGDGRYPVTTHITPPDLSITKSAPLVTEPGIPFTYTLTVDNNSQVTVHDLVITDTLPTGTTYVGGGTFDNGEVTWEANSLEPGESLAVQFAVTTEITAVNRYYGVRIAGGNLYLGEDVVITFIAPEQVWLPLVLRP